MNKGNLTAVKKTIEAVSKATSVAAINSILAKAQKTLPIKNGIIQLDTKKYWLLIAVFIVVAILGSTFLFQAHLAIAIIFAIAMVIVAVFTYFLFIYPTAKTLKILTDACFQRMVSYKYGIEENENFSVEELQNKYTGFPSGDRYYGFDLCVDSKMGGMKHINFIYYYEEEYEETTTDADGNTKTKTYYQKYYINGIIISNVTFPDITFGRGWHKNKKLWYPTSPDFNKAYYISAGENMTLAKYFTPSKVEQLIAVSKTLPKNFYLQSQDNEVCISYTGANLLNLRPTITSKHFKDFCEYINKENFPKYQNIMNDLVNSFGIEQGKT